MLTEQEINNIISDVRARLSTSVEGLEFIPETHTYLYHGRELTPVSDVCKIFERNFDSDYWSRRKAAEAGVSQQQMLKQWRDNSDRACREGTDVHSYAEWHFHKFTGIQITDQVLRGIDSQVKAGTFVKDDRMCSVDYVWQAMKQAQSLGRDYKLYPIASENRIINPELNYAGTFDLLCLRVNADGTYGLVIFDYKTNGNLFNVFRKSRGLALDSMQSPLDDMSACNAANYACQLNLYQMGLERVLDIPVIDRVLLWVNPTGANAIARNSRDHYSDLHYRLASAGKSTKWKYSAYYIDDIAALKRRYNFAYHNTFGILHLPLLKDRIYAHLRTTITH